MALYKKSGYVEPLRMRECKDQTFSAKWGERADQIAKREDVAITTIHMRVRNFGSPYMRAAKPHSAEELCGKTIYQLAEELNLHPITVQQRIRNHKNPYQSERGTRGFIKPVYKSGRKRCWLMEEHPCYEEWKKERQIDDAFLKIKAGYQE